MTEPPNRPIRSGERDGMARATRLAPLGPSCVADTSVSAALSGLTWLTPATSSLLALARSPDDAWSAVRCDPGAVLLLLRSPQSPNGSFPQDCLHAEEPLALALASLRRPPQGCVDQSSPIMAASLALARLTLGLALRVASSHTEKAWCCGLLAPLGWLVQDAVAPRAVANCLADHEFSRQPTVTLTRHGLLSPDVVARRFCRSWKLPEWLVAVVDRLDWPLAQLPESAETRTLSALLRLALRLARDLGHDLNLFGPVDTTPEESSLGFSLAELRAEEILTSVPENPPSGSPYSVPLLLDVLELGLENRRLRKQPTVNRLAREVDDLQAALREQVRGEASRLHNSKLSALAEMAAGAGHEINNPLAVISGQAQYLLNHQDDLLSPDPEGTASKALQTIIGQTKRIHSLLRELMLFARPLPPTKRVLDLPTLLGESAAALAEFAMQKRVRVEVATRPERLAVFVDAEQVKMALGCLLRNAIEAAGVEGWARLQMVVLDTSEVAVQIEDSGPGPTPRQRPHLFEPLYSGREAGRSRGLGLPIAWRLVCNQGGSLHHEPPRTGQPTRFVLRLPRAEDNGGQVASGAA